MSRITDSEVRALASIATTLQVDYAADDLQWQGSPFAWIKARPSRQVGAVGEKLVAGWLAAKGFDVTRSPDSEADRVIEGARAEIKFSSLWKTGLYKFQQLRDQNYAFAVCLGVSPFNAHCWVIPKATIMEKWSAGEGIVSQHGGTAGSDTAWLSVTPGEEPAWLQRWGGTLSVAANLIVEITGRQPLGDN